MQKMRREGRVAGTKGKFAVKNNPSHLLKQQEGESGVKEPKVESKNAIVI